MVRIYLSTPSLATLTQSDKTSVLTFWLTQHFEIIFINM